MGLVVGLRKLFPFFPPGALFQGNPGSQRRACQEAAGPRDVNGPPNFSTQFASIPSRQRGAHVFFSHAFSGHAYLVACTLTIIFVMVFCSQTGSVVFFWCGFSCFGFSCVYSFAVWAGACFVFCCLGGGGAPPKKTPKQQKNVHAPRPFRKCFFLLFDAVWTGGRLSFCCLGGVFVFFAVWAGAGVFAVWAGGALLFLLFGGGAFLFCCLGGGWEFSHLPVCLIRL